MVPIMFLILTLNLAQVAFETPRQPVHCLQLCTIEASVCQIEELCSNDSETEAQAGEEPACVPIMQARSATTAMAFRRRSPIKPEGCEAKGRVVQAKTEKLVWIDYEAEGRHGNRGVRWKMVLQPPYKLVTYEAPGYILTRNTRAFRQRGRNVIRVFYSQGNNRCCVRGYLRGKILKGTPRIASIKVRIDGRLDPEPDRSVKTSFVDRGRTTPDPQRYCWPEGILHQRRWVNRRGSVSRASPASPISRRHVPLQKVHRVTRNVVDGKGEICSAPFPGTAYPFPRRCPIRRADSILYRGLR